MRSDELFWTGMIADIDLSADGIRQRTIDARAYQPDINDLRRRIESIVPYFCANPGCIQAFCPRHGRFLSTSRRCVYHATLPMIQCGNSLLSHRPYLESRVMIIPMGIPVGACVFETLTRLFRYICALFSARQFCSHDLQEDSVQWGDPEVDELLCILEIIPDTIPCGLAKLVRKPCREVLKLPQLVRPILYSLNPPTGVHSAPTSHSRR
jgi:hypothetical protein